MSSAIAAVRFPDGEIRFGIFHGTSNLMSPALFATPEEACKARWLWPEIDDAEREPAELWITYGGGFGWNVTATRRRIIAPLDYMGLPTADEIHDEPDWSPWKR